MISIIIRTYNNGSFIQKAVDSALQQDYPDFEVIVVNDGSTDNTATILNSFHDQKLKIIHQENKGMIEAGYQGLRLAQGEEIIFVDGDDEALPTMLKELQSALAQQSENSFAYADYYELDLSSGKKKEVSCKNIFNTLACGILFKKKVLEKQGFWDRRLIFPEYDLLIRLQKENKGVHVAKLLYLYQRHPHSFTANKRKVQEGKKQLIAKYGPLPGFKKY